MIFFLKFEICPDKRINIRNRRSGLGVHLLILTLFLMFWSFCNRFQCQQTESECALLRRELALAIVDNSERRRFEVVDRRNRYARTTRSLSRDNDPTLLLMKEREEARRRSNYRLFVRAKEKQVRTTEKVKEFVIKLQEDMVGTR